MTSVNTVKRLCQKKIIENMRQRLTVKHQHHKKIILEMDLPLIDLVRPCTNPVAFST